MAFKFVVLCSLLAIANAGVISPLTYGAAPAVAVAHKVAYANPAVDAIASTQQNVLRSFGGTVSSYSKAIDTPYSSVRKQDTRISNNVYTPAIAKTVTSYAAPTAAVYTHAAPTAAVYTHAAPVVAKTVYSSPAPVVYSHQAPAVYHHAAPTAAVYSHAAPAVAKTVYSSPAPVVYSHSAPAVYHHAAPTAAVYTHAAPAVAKTVTYAAPAVAKTVTYAAPATTTYNHGPATTTYNHGPAATTYTHNAPGVSGYGSSQTVHYSPAEMVSHMSFDGFGTHWGY